MVVNDVEWLDTPLWSRSTYHFVCLFEVDDEHTAQGESET